MRGRIIRGVEAPRRMLRLDRGTSAELVNAQVGASALDVHVNHLRPGTGPGPYHLHSHSENVYYLLSGRLLVRLDGFDHVLEPGDAAFIPPGVPHSATNADEDEAVLLEVYAPPPADFVEVADPAPETARGES